MSWTHGPSNPDPEAYVEPPPDGPNTLVFDIETDGFLESMTKIHCITARTDEGQILSFHDYDDRVQPCDGPIWQGVEVLSRADRLVGHNIDAFDVPAIQKIFPDFEPADRFDTLVASRLIWPEIRVQDMIDARRGRFPAKLVGWHSLEAWGYRLGLHKGDFGKTSDWSGFSKEMLDYCAQDTQVTAKLLAKIEKQEYRKSAFDLEHAFAAVLNRQMEHGIVFDVAKAKALVQELTTQRAVLDFKLTNMIPPFETEHVTPKKKIRSTKITPFNPNSRDHIAMHLIDRRGWTPEEYTESGGKPKIDENILKRLPWPEAQTLMERFLVQKRLGQLDEGEKGWLKLVGSDGRIHGRIIHNGAVTGRCTHSGPNLSAVPKVKAKGGKVLLGVEGEYGWECRSLFTVPEGWKMVGADAAGIELRMLAHYMARYDGGEYAKIVTEGDPHEANRIAAGLETRDQAKTFIYAWLYGAGDGKLGNIVKKGPEAGRVLRERFLRAIPALAELKKTILRLTREHGALRSLDGRLLQIRSDHSALNTALQGGAAVVMKKATVLLDEKIRAAGLAKSAFQVLHVHDEFQIEVRAEHAEQVGQFAVQAIRDAGVEFRLRCPLDGEYKIGTSWAETH